MAWNRNATPLIFDEDFDRTPVAQPQVEPATEPVFTAADVEAARRQAWQDGHDTGSHEAETTTAALTRDALITIAERMHSARAEASAIAEEAAETLAVLVMDAFAAAFPALCAQHADAELRAIVCAVIPRLREESTIRVHVETAMANVLVREIGAMDGDLADRVRIVPVDTMAASDLRITWHAGSATRDTARLWAEIEAVLAPAGLLTTSLAPNQEIPRPTASPPTKTTKEIEHVQ
jgi:flagellar biosynthesis/type III secretory pathway protein FliH